MFSLESLVRAVVYIVTAGLILYLLHYLVDHAGVPEPYHKVAKVVLLVFGVLFLIGVLLSLAGTPLVRW